MREIIILYVCVSQGLENYRIHKFDWLKMIIDHGLDFPIQHPDQLHFVVKKLPTKIQKYYFLFSSNISRSAKKPD